ncbi:MAG TPA: IS630 transposase-related protein [Herpetosiphonaceae bacterium]
MKAYSQDLRERVIHQWTAGKSQAELVTLFAVSKGSIKRWIRQHRTTGSVAPKVRQQWSRTIGPDAHDALRAQVAQFADATLEQHVAIWAQTQGVHVSSSTMWRALTAIGWPLKKNARGRRAR